MSLTETVAEASSVEFDTSFDIDLEFPSVQEYLASHDIAKDDPRSELELTELLEPVVLSSSITTTYVKDLNELLQQPPYFVYNLHPLFSYHSTTTENGVPGHSATLKIECRTTNTIVKELTSEGCFPSKKHAKEAAAVMGLEYVKGFGEEITSLPQRPVEDSLVALDPEETENWVGNLQSFCQKWEVLPKYTYYQRRKDINEFSCDLTTNIPGTETKIFGDKTKFYRTKKAGKIQAAKEAVAWITDHPPSPPAKKKKGLVAGKSAVSAITMLPPGSVITVRSDARAVENVAIICPQLGLSQPEYDVVQEERAPSIYDVTAIITRQVGRKVKIGPLKGILGKKNAKGRMAESIFKWLEKEAERNQITIRKADL